MKANQKHPKVSDDGLINKKTKAAEKQFPGYPLYPPSEDIYNNAKEVNLDPDDLSKPKALNEKPGTKNEKTFRDDKTGGDLDVPGSELDDSQENIGSEDEENNIYSEGDN